MRCPSREGGGREREEGGREKRDTFPNTERMILVPGTSGRKGGRVDKGVEEVFRRVKKKEIK